MTTEVKTTDATLNAGRGSTAMAAALKTIGFGSEDLQRAAEVLADDEVLKSVSSLSAQELSRTELVRDRWIEGHMHAVPTREQLRTGPPQASSGGGAERFVREYSNPAPQDGLMMESMRLSDELGSIRAYMRSMGDQFAALAKHQEATTTILTALVGNTGPARGDITITDELTSFAAQCAGKSQKFLDAARSTLARAVTMKSEIGELSGDARKLRKSEIKTLRANAASLIVKAQEAALAACSGGADTTGEIRKAISTLVEADPLLKAEAEEMREKMRKKEEKACTKKALKKSLKRMVKKAAAKVAAKAATAAAETVKNNQADSQDSETKNQDDKSVSTKAELSAEHAEMVKKAVDGVAMLQGTVADLMSVLNGRTVTNGATQPLTLVKSDPNNGSELLDQMGRVEKAIAAGILSDEEQMRARDIAGKYTAVTAGVMAKSIWASYVKKSSRSVQELFPEAA